MSPRALRAWHCAASARTANWCAACATPSKCASRSVFANLSPCAFAAAEPTDALEQGVHNPKHP